MQLCTWKAHYLENTINNRVPEVNIIRKRAFDTVLLTLLPRHKVSWQSNLLGLSTQPVNIVALCHILVELP